jgi:kynurenine formamidase
MKYIDLTHAFTSSMPVFPGDPAATLKQVAHLETDSFNDHKLTTIMHVGTHMDAPLHMIENGKKIDELNIESFFASGVLIDARNKKVIDATILDGKDIPTGSAVLLYTGLGENYRSPSYFENYPAVTPDFAEAMVACKVKMVGMDTAGPDHAEPWQTHKILLSHDIVILENLTNLDKLVGINNFEVIALPAKLQADAAPVRVVALIND